MAKTETAPIESVDRALKLILLLRESGPISVKAAAEYLDVAPSTAHRLLSALAFRGFVRQDKERQYRSGPVHVHNEDTTISLNRLRECSRSPMQALHEKVAETVQLMILRGPNIQFIDGVEAESTLRVAMRFGDQMPAFASAGGKAILAELTNSTLEQIYRRGLPAWPTSRITTMAQLKSSMATVRRNEFGTNFEETEQGVIGVGVSIRNPSGVPVAGLTTASPSVRFRREMLDTHVTALRTASAEIAAAIAAHND